MATNTYTYGSLGERWVVETPTSKANLDISRVKADANRWTLTQLLDDPDDSPFALADGTTATTQSAGDNSTKIATTAYADAAAPSYQTMRIGDTFKIEVSTSPQVIWSLGWFQSSDGRWWLLGNTANVDSFARADAEFYIPTGDINDVPSS